MKYIDADKLIAEIKEWRNKQIGFAWDAVNEVLKIVSSIQQEQPEVDIYIQQELYHHFGQVKDFTLGVAIASYFYELGQCNARKEE